MPSSSLDEQIDLLGTPTARPKRRSRARKPAASWSLTAFGAPWSAPWPLLRDQLTELVGDGVPVTFIDVDEDPGSAERHRIIVVPTILVIRDGSERRRITGAVSARDLRDIVGKK